MKHRDNDNSWVIPIVVAMLLIVLSGANHDIHAAPWIEIHGLSKHGKNTYSTETGVHQYNEVNLGMGAMFKMNNNVEAGFGFFRNSYNINTFYAGGDIHTDNRAPVRLGLSFAIVDGYQNTPASSNVMILPNLTITLTEHLRIKMGVIPTGIKLATLTLGVKF